MLRSPVLGFRRPGSSQRADDLQPLGRYGAGMNNAAVAIATGDPDDISENDGDNSDDSNAQPGNPESTPSTIGFLSQSNEQGSTNDSPWTNYYFPPHTATATGFIFSGNPLFGAVADEVFHALVSPRMQNSPGKGFACVGFVFRGNARLDFEQCRYS